MNAPTTLTTNGVERANLSPLPGAQPVHPNAARRFDPEITDNSPAPIANRRLTRKQMMMGVLILVALELVVAKLTYDWWTVGRFIEKATD